MYSWFQNDRIYYVHRARTAIRHLPQLLRSAPGDEILMPAYNCGTEVDPLLHAAVSVVLYRVDQSGRIDVADIRRRVKKKTKAVYVTHYFGFPQSLTELKQFCREKNLYLIEDCALSLFSSDGATRLGTMGDASVVSFAKTLPVPDGGALVVNNPDLELGQWRLRAPKAGTVLNKILPLIKSAVLRSLSNGTARHPLYDLLLGLRASWTAGSGNHAHAPQDWQKMPEDYYYSSEITNRAMSSVTKRAIGRFDFKAITEKRRANFKRFLEILPANGKILPLFGNLPPGVCPLHFPVVITERNRVCAKLNEKSIDAIPWWAGYHRELSWKEFDEARFLKDSLLALPIHQDLDENDVEFIADNLLAAA